ncbi:hypothetical protein MHB44_08840 [Lysinibacillus sp. FSL H8-0500]|uniref:hypothetical protein n=1 Tax=Lysinibacillus sp. FSL H8-0500 TaxID=2921393 RepID=UPI003100FB03
MGDFKQMVAIGIIMLLLLGNSIVYFYHQLAQPITVPLIQDFYRSNDSHHFKIHYITNKSDSRFVTHLEADSLILLEATNGTADIIEENAHQLIRVAYFSGDNQEIETLLHSKHVYVVLNDGERLTAALHLAWEDPSQQGDYFLASSGSSNGDTSVIYKVAQDTSIHTVHVPACLKPRVNFEHVKVNGELYKEEDFPIAVKKGQTMNISFQVHESGADVAATVSVSGPDEVWPVSVIRDAPLQLESIQKELQQDDCYR